MVIPQSHSDRLETLTEIGRAVSSKLELHILYDTIYAQVGRVMDATLFSLAIYEPDQGRIALPYIREAGKLFLDQSIPFGAGVTSLVIQQGRPLMFQSNDEYQEYAQANGLPAINVGEDEGEAVVFVPLHTGSKVIGVLSVESKRVAAYTDEDLETLSIIASQAAVAIENARLFERSREAIRQMAVLAQIAQTITGLPVSDSISAPDCSESGTSDTRTSDVARAPLWASPRDLYAVLDAILLSMREVMPYAFAALLLPDYTTHTLDIVGSIWRDQALSSVRDGVTLKIPFGQGISGAVFASGEPLIVPDVREFEGFVDHELTGVFSEMAVPLKRADSTSARHFQTIGVLDVGREGVNAFSDDEVNLLSLFASQAAIAIENARLFAEQRHRVEELQTIQSIVRRLMPLQDQSEMAALIDAELKRLIDYQACRVYLMDGELPMLIPMRGLSGTQAPRLSIDRGFAGWIARTGQSDIIPNTEEDERPDYIPGTAYEAESMVGAPLRYEGRVRGVITLSKVGINQFDQNALRVLEIIAAQLAMAFDRARLYEELRTDAITDPLVPLWNRRYMLERYREERSRAVRTCRPLAAIMLDIDKFKRVNDTYGHDAGDVVLQELATLVRHQVRTEDIVARWGGEEFCILLPESSIAEAVFIAQRVCQTIAEHRLPPAAGADRVTASLGVASSWVSDVGEELFSRADAAMYRVKAAGGNGIALADASDESAIAAE